MVVVNKQLQKARQDALAHISWEFHRGKSLEVCLCPDELNALYNIFGCWSVTWVDIIYHRSLRNI